MTTPELPPPAPSAVRLTPLPPFTPDLYQRAWASVPHPTLPLLATTHAKAVTVFSLSTMSKHSSLAGGHSRSVRCAAWKPGLPPHRLCLVTGSFDATAGLWRWDGDAAAATENNAAEGDAMEVDVAAAAAGRGADDSDGEQPRRGGDGDDDDDDDWEFTLVLEGHENEIKGAAFSPSGQYLATCSRDKSVWVWEDVGATEADDEWETVAVLSEHDGDVKAVAWCPDVPGRNRGGGGGTRYSADVLASASYDDTARIWREDADGEWVCVAVLEGHEGTVWGLQWEPSPPADRFPRLLTFSADMTIRIWTLREDEEEEGNGAEAAGDGSNQLFRSGLGGIPNTMRRGIAEDWDCTAVLPKIHTRDIYSVTWSAASGLVASTGSDGIIAVYGEDQATGAQESAGAATASAISAQSSTPPTEGTDANQHQEPAPQPNGLHPSSDRWRILGSVSNGHGPYEINNITWCKRFDPGSERRGVEEMLVTSGDDGIIRPWEVA